MPGVVAPVGAGMILGRSAAVYRTGVVGAFWLWSRSTSRPAFLVDVRRLAELVEDARAELDRVGAAELLLGEADRERGREPARRADRRDRERGRDVQRPAAQRPAGPGQGVDQLQLPDPVDRLPCETGEQAAGLERAGKGGGAPGDRRECGVV